MEKQRIRIKISGTVQGVGYRFFTQRSACTLGIKGFVENEPDGSVTIEAEGDTTQLAQFLGSVEKGPQWARVKEVNVEEILPMNDEEFSVR
jgi:acylphosphatase